ncbi:MAG: hypothetical protein ACK47M_03325 [Caldilinea sp.]
MFNRFSWKQRMTLGLVAIMMMAMFALLPQTSFAQSNDSADQPAIPAKPWGRGGMMFGFGARGEFRNQHEAFLADTLGITVEQLQAAQQKAHEAMIAQAVEEGYLTQEQADLMAARHAFMQFHRNNATLTFEDALNAAVEAGAITQEQADLLKEAQGQWGCGMEGWRNGGRGNFRPHGIMPGRGNRMMPGYRTPTPDANS